MMTVAQHKQPKVSHGVAACVRAAKIASESAVFWATKGAKEPNSCYRRTRDYNISLRRRWMECARRAKARGLA